MLVAGACAVFTVMSGIASEAAPSGQPGALEEGDVIYQVLVDRFDNADSSNDDFGDGATRTDDLGFYHGGDRMTVGAAASADADAAAHQMGIRQ